MLTPRVAMLCLLLTISCACLSQDQPAKGGDLLSLSSRFLERLQRKTSSLNDQLTRQTERYIERMAKKEARLQKKLAKLDPGGAERLFAHTQENYQALAQKIAADTGAVDQRIGGNYQPYVDSLQGMLGFLHSEVTGKLPMAGESLREFRTLQAKLTDADQLKNYVRERKQQIAAYVQTHTQFGKILSEEYGDVNKQLYYYSRRVQDYREMLNDPDKLMQQTLFVLNKIPAFQTFMQQHSQLAGLLSLPGGYGDPSAIDGLQTKDQVAAIIQQQVAAAGPNGAAILQGNLQAAESKLDGFKSKLNKLGSGGGDIDMPDFAPNDQKTKTFLRRLEYGTNFQTTRTNYAFPTVSDIGLSVGYKISDRNIAGVGASYKLGWGNGIRDIHFSSQGMGVRSFVEVKIKNSFSATGGLEYNYTIPIQSMQQLRVWDKWSRSGLIGVSKQISMKSRVFKKSKMQLLWDFLSYQQVPRTQAVIFRIGYGF